MRDNTEERKPKPRILVVDDQATMRFLVSEVLQQAGFDIQQAQSGIEALRLIEQSPPDLVILDLVMPEMDGFAVCEKIRSRASTQYLPVLMMTGLDDEESIIRAYDTGATDFIEKPFKRFVMAQRVRAILRARRTEQKMHQLAYYDSLTGLSNRESFKHRLSHTIALAKRHNRLLGVLYLNLDDFKRINDTLGHSVGDALLKAVAARLLDTIRECDAISQSAGVTDDMGGDGGLTARLGGDEFIILLSEIRLKQDAATVAGRILASLSHSFVLAGYEVFITPSIGIAVFPDDAVDTETLLKNADAAMYAAKRSGKNTFSFYDGSMNEAALHRLNIDNELRKALDRGELFLQYQPQMDAIRNRVCGMEALLRWNSNSLGFVSPADFIPVAEESGLIVSIGEWVLRCACSQAKAWMDQGLRVGRMSVNISVLQFAQPGFVELVARILKETELDARCLELEITESLLAKDVTGAIETLTALKALRVQLAIDDFGTGYSSLSYLKRFPIDRLKIDRSFISDITSDPDDAAIATAVTAMATSMSLGVIAEGVETEAQLSMLIERGCHEIQGYYFSRPLSTDDMTSFLQQNATSHKQWRKNTDSVPTVLFLDDDELILDAVRQYLELEEYRILTANNTNDAFNILATHRVDVLVADYQMPDMIGTEFVRRAKKMFPATICIMLSGESDMQSVIEAVNTGALYKFLEKPIHWDLLCNTLQEAMILLETDKYSEKLAATS